MTTPIHFNEDDFLEDNEYINTLFILGDDNNKTNILYKIIKIDIIIL